jgi:hypothetical protein
LRFPKRNFSYTNPLYCILTQAMKITEKTIRFLGRVLCGDTGLIPYKSGPQLVDFLLIMVQTINMAKDFLQEGDTQNKT